MILAEKGGDIVNIPEDSKKIVRYFLEKAVEYGDLDMISSDFWFSYDSLASTLGFKDVKYCRICCQYLTGHAYIKIATQRKENSTDENSIQRCVRLSSSAIDFLETT